LGLLHDYNFWQDHWRFNAAHLYNSSNTINRSEITFYLYRCYRIAYELCFRLKYVHILQQYMYENVVFIFRKTSTYTIINECPINTNKWYRPHWKSSVLGQNAKMLHTYKSNWHNNTELENAIHVNGIKSIKQSLKQNKNAIPKTAFLYLFTSQTKKENTTDIIIHVYVYRFLIYFSSST